MTEPEALLVLDVLDFFLALDVPECVFRKRAFFSASLSSARSEGRSAPPRNVPRERINNTLEAAATGNRNTT